MSMKVEDFFFRRYGTRRRVNPDGTIKIACKKCGSLIDVNSNMTTQKITTVVCHKCYTGQPLPAGVPIIDGRPRPDLISMEQEELLKAIFDGERAPEPGTIEDMMLRSRKDKEKFSILNLARGAFRALAYPSRKGPELDESKVTYEVADAESSKTISKRKRRTPIFGKGSNTDESR